MTVQADFLRKERLPDFLVPGDSFLTFVPIAHLSRYSLKIIHKKMVLELGWYIWRKYYYTKYQKISMLDIKIITWEFFHVYLQPLTQEPTYKLWMFVYFLSYQFMCKELPST